MAHMILPDGSQVRFDKAFEIQDAGHTVCKIFMVDDRVVTVVDYTGLHLIPDITKARPGRG